MRFHDLIGSSAHGPPGPEGYCWFMPLTQAAQRHAAINWATADVRVVARGCAARHATTRTRLIATAIRMWCAVDTLCVDRVAAGAKDGIDTVANHEMTMLATSVGFGAPERECALVRVVRAQRRKHVLSADI